MKKINSIDYGGKIIGAGLMFTAAVPIGLHALKQIWNSPMIRVMQSVSIGVGSALLVGFCCLLAIELRQDRLINAYYAENPATRKTPQQILDERAGRRLRMSKYNALWAYVRENGTPSFTLTFDEIQKIAGFPIDHSFLTYKKELTDSGYLVDKISLKTRTVAFKRID